MIGARPQSRLYHPGAMSRWRRILAVVGAAIAMVGVVPAHALASTIEQSMLLDDDQLIYSTPKHMVQTLETLHTLGVDVVKVSVVWQLIAPNANSSRRPNFDATNPAAYPPGAWSRWDTLVETAQQLGMKVYFLVIGPAPVWAVPPANRSNQGPPLGWMPNPADYRNFVEAVGRRYSGAYVDPPPPAPGNGLPPVGGITVPTTTLPGTAARSSAASASAATPIPRVTYWGIWNEPNERSWLVPWYRQAGRRRVLIQPQEYRALVDAAWQGLQASSHSSDTILVGETANRGIMSPVPFMRALYCVGGNLRPLRGTAAANYGCPSSSSSFVSQHPGLFSGAYAHHPYGFQAPPNRRSPEPGFITLYNMPSFERTLNRIFASYGQHPSGGVTLYLTEWGFKTNPPNPYVRTTPAQQAAWIDQGEYMTWRWPYVRGLTQFLLVDSPPKPDTKKGSALYWSTFQTGLEYINGKKKPSFQAFMVPIWLPVQRHGGHVTVWAQLRPAAHNTTQYGVIEFQRKGSSSWKELTEVQTDSPEGFVYNHVSIPSAGNVRLGWLDPDGSVFYSRVVPVS
jgi:hypothetical protein